MKLSSSVLLAAVAIFASCGQSKPDMTMPAITGIPTPVFDGMIDATRGNILRMLPPQTTVYVQGDSLKINDQGYVKVWWNDSSGYVPAGWVMPNFKKAVHFTSGEGRIYVDEEMTTLAGQLLPWQLISVGEARGKVTPFIHEYNGDAMVMFVETASVFADTLDVAFYDALQTANNDVATIEALKANKRFKDSRARLAKLPGGLGEDVSSEYKIEGAGAKNHIAAVWYDQSDKALATSAYPGNFELHFVWEDGTESQLNHFGDHLENSYIDCIPDLFAQVSKYRLVFTPKEAMDFKFETNIAAGPVEMERSKEFTGVVAGQTYTFDITTGSYESGCNDIMFSVVMKNGVVGKGPVSAGCGD